MLLHPRQATLALPIVSWQQVQRQEEDLRNLTGEIAQLEARVQEEQEKQMADASLRQQMQQAKAAARKKEEAAGKLEKLRERLRAVKGEYEEKAASAEHTRAASAAGPGAAAAAEFGTAEELQARQESVRAKLEKYRPLKRGAQPHARMRTPGRAVKTPCCQARVVQRTTT